MFIIMFVMIPRAHNNPLRLAPHSPILGENYQPSPSLRATPPLATKKMEELLPQQKNRRGGGFYL